jgi:hypothetical protein
MNLKSAPQTKPVYHPQSAQSAVLISVFGFSWDGSNCLSHWLAVGVFIWFDLVALRWIASLETWQSKGAGVKSGSRG